MHLLLSKNKCVINKKIFSEEAEEIVFKFFSDILSLVSGTYYPTKIKKSFKLNQSIKTKVNLISRHWVVALLRKAR